jgi:hypothetical protein
VRLARRYALVAFLTHASFISISLIPGIRAIPLLAGDSARYVRVAMNIVEHGAISSDSAPPFRWEGDRPPGYPLLIASSVLVTGQAHWALYFAAVSAALAAWAAVTLAGIWGAPHATLHAAGLFVALMPNSLGLSAMLLVDAIFGHMMLTWCCLVHLSFRRSSHAPVIGTLLVFGLLQLLRPQLLVLGWAMILFAILVLGQPRRRLIVGSIVMLGSFVVPSYLTLRTYRDHGVATPTMVGIRSGREYLQATYLAEQSGIEFVRARDRVREEDSKAAELLKKPESQSARRYLVGQTRLKEFVLRHPADVARLMSVEFARQAIAPQEFAASLMMARVPTLVRILGMCVTLLLLALAVFGARRSDRRAVVFLAGICAFYLATGSLSRFNSSRLRFPADMAAVPMAAVGAIYFRSRARSTIRLISGRAYPTHA